MKISLIVPDINSNVLGAATILARHLADQHTVEVIGPDMGHGVCPLYNGAFPYRVIPCPRIYRFPDFFSEMHRLMQAVTGQVVIAVKAYADTVGAAWYLKRVRGVKAIAYLDEWDGALMRQMTVGQRLRRFCEHAHHPLDEVYAPWVERLLPRMDMVLSTTSFLQQRYGGEILHLGIDTDYFRPQPAECAQALRQQYGLDGLKLIIFGGVVRPHKGIEWILEALACLARPDVRLVIVGPKNEHVEALLRQPRYRPHLVALGPQPKDLMPLFLELATLIVLPLIDNLLARSQMPCKVFEAMAMAKPVIASAVSDLPEVLQGCGRIVPPNDVAALAAAIDEMCANPALALQLGLLAREKCMRHYSAAVTQAKLQRIIETL